MLPEQMRGIEANRHKIATQLGISISDSTAAMILGIDEQDYHKYCETLHKENIVTCQELLKNPQTAEFVQMIVKLGKQVVAMGDSITTCRFSYAELLRLLLEPHGVSLSNWGVGGYTSAHALEYCYNTALLNLKPNLIFLSYGVNDAKYFGDTSKMFVSHAEYEANMAAVVKALQKQTDAQLVLLTPTPVIEDWANYRAPAFHHSVHWNNNDLLKAGDTLKRIAKKHNIAVVDMFSAFGPPPDTTLYLDDGVHPNRAGERYMLEQIVKQLVL